MAKLEGHWGKDNRERDCLFLHKSKGWINRREVYEWMCDHRMQGVSLVHMADCPSDEIPIDLYEEGDTWILYEAESILEELAQRASDSTGYNYRITRS